MSVATASVTADHVLTPVEIKRLQTQADTDTLVAAFHREQLRALRTGEYTKLQEPSLGQR